jgi:CheY-like chemotaxis protein
MEKEDLEQACNAFFRGRSASLAEAEGIGLGLAISRHMADLMHSLLHMESAPGQGTRVSIRLPLAAEAGALRPGPRAGLAGALQGRLVAVVENDRQAREALCAWLQEAGARVAHGGTLAQLQQALAAEGEPPDFLLADYRLGDATGMQAIEAVRAQHGPVPALVISGEPDILDRGLPWPVLQKPVAPERLLEAMQSALQQPQSLFQPAAAEA